MRLLRKEGQGEGADIEGEIQGEKQCGALNEESTSQQTEAAGEFQEMWNYWQRGTIKLHQSKPQASFSGHKRPSP